MDKLFIVLAGNIGTGKTTLTRYLSERFNWLPHYESVTDNPYLEDFYKDMKRWSFPLQIYFLGHRYNTHKSILEQHHSAVQDRCIYEDANIFARNLYESGMMEPRDYHTYKTLYEQMIEKLPAPDPLVYLRKSLPTLKRQISERGRDYEKTISDDYLSCLNRYYDDWVLNYKLGKSLVIESDKLDFVRNSGDFEFICKQILEAIPQQGLFAPPPVDQNLFQ